MLTYKGKEITEITEPFIFPEGKEMLAWNDDNVVLHVRVFALLEKPILDGFKVIGRGNFYKHCAYYPNDRKPSVKEVATWLLKGNGFILDEESGIVQTSMSFTKDNENEPIADGYKLRRIDDENWVTPTIKFLKGE